MIGEIFSQLSIQEIPDTDTIAGLTGFFAKKDNRIKRLVLFEVCSLIPADNHVGDTEQEAYEYVKTGFALGETVIEDIVSAANGYKIIKDRVYDVVFV